MELENLKPEEFDAHVENGRCRLAFVGMSNSGKSYRSRVLQNEAGFFWYEVDKAIQEELGCKTVEEMAYWVGYPTSATYGEREERYLELENKYTKHAAMQTNGRNLVFDTTGSVVHLEQSTLHTLRENCLIVHLEVSEEIIATMLKRFFKDPKPVVWAEHFEQFPGETEEEAVRRCYPKLLADRLRKYRTLSHINIPTSRFHDKTAEETLAILRSYL